MSILEGFSLEELKKISLLVNSFDSRQGLINTLDSEIKKREEDRNKSLNVKFDMNLFKKLNMFYPDELKVLEVNNIRNLQDLIDCDLNSLVGITESIKEKLDWARKFYDMEPKRKIKK